MTRKEAIQVLNMVEAHGGLVIQAKEMAIEALRESERKHSKWINKGTYSMCALCKHIEPFPSFPPYCPMCGAQMNEREKAFSLGDIARNVADQTIEALKQEEKEK